MSEQIELNKDERRRIIATLDNWNVGITPNGKLATDSCFVHNAVPDIVYHSKSNSKVIQNTYTFTTSDWAENLVLSNTSNPNDTETLKSLSVCKAIFQNIEPSLLETAEKETMHITVQSVKAYVVVDNIARLTKEFEDELSKAEEHWPHRPQKSWDKLCRIWNKYGFLWPQRVQIGFKIHRKTTDLEQDDIQTVKNHLKKESQDVLHSPKYYSVIWRTRLKPVHEYFPAQYNQKKEYINNIIHKFSLLVFSDSLFRLRNVRSGDYLGCDSFNNEEVKALPCHDHKSMNTSNIFWKLNDSITAIEQQSTPYIFVENSKFLCSGQQQSTTTVKEETTAVLCKLNNQPTISDNRSYTPQSRSGIKLVHYKQPTQSQHSSSTSSSMNDMDTTAWKWFISIPNNNNSNNNRKNDDIFYLEKEVNNIRCIIHGDEITLNQQSFYLRAAPNYPTTFNFSSSRPQSTTSPSFTNTKSPLSTMSYGDQYNFSPQGMSESNSTQPTSGSNSSSPLQQKKNNKVTENTAKTTTRSPPLQNNSIVFMEKLFKKNNLPSTEFRWKVELISKSLMDEQQQQQEEEMINVVKSLSSLKSNLSPDDEKKTIKKRYSPKLRPDITRFSSPDITTTLSSQHHHSTVQALIDNNRYNPPIMISSMVVVEDKIPTVLSSQQQQQQRYTSNKHQKSKWLEVDPHLYNLQKRTIVEEENTTHVLEKQPSVVSIASPPDSILPPAEENKLLSKKQAEKLPLQFTAHYNRHRPSSTDSEESAWTTSSPVDKNQNTDLNVVSSSPTPSPVVLTEAEAFKRDIQQNYKDKDDVDQAHNIILKNILAPPSLRSNTTSQMWNCDDEDDDEIIYDHHGGGSSQARTYTMTPRSRYSQQLTPASSANLTPEEYMQRRKNRENSFLLLVDNETKQQFWLRAIKQSSLSHWLKIFSPSTKIIKQYRNTNTAVNSFSNHSSSIKSHRKSKSNNRTVRKTKAFYKKNNRRQEGIVI